jgi:hypothetical protein
VARGPWPVDPEELPFTPDDLRIYKKLVAVRSFNCDELFGRENAEHAGRVIY